MDNEISDLQIQNLAKRLKQLRKEKGYNNYELFAFENGISRSQYGKYEKGSDIRFSTLLKVLNALDISLKDFFAEGFEDTNQKPEETK